MSPCTQSPNSRMPGVEMMLPPKGDSNISRWLVVRWPLFVHLSTQPVSEEVLRDIVETARWTGASKNSELWRLW